jgi:RDD family
MTVEAVDPASPPADEGVAYARYTRRLKAYFLDWVLMIALMFGGLFIAIQFGSDNVARPLGFTIIAVLLLYEPLLVSLFGSTIGHYGYNMRVVDNRTGGNVSFFKAVVRVVIKAVLGIYSFISMAMTRRHQAMHDLLTQSTVQVRDAAKADPAHFAGEDLELVGPGMPSRWRRIVVIVCYEIAWYIGPALGTVGLEAAHLVSAACMDHTPVCTPRELAVFGVYALVWLAGVVLLIVLGWRGRLWGARRTRTQPI